MEASKIIDIVYWFSDGSINALITIIAADFKVLGVLIGSPLVFYLSKLAKRTSWKGDDLLLDQIANRLGIKTEADK